MASAPLLIGGSCNDPPPVQEGDKVRCRLLVEFPTASGSTVELPKDAEFCAQPEEGDDLGDVCRDAATNGGFCNINGVELTGLTFPTVLGCRADVDSSAVLTDDSCRPPDTGSRLSPQAAHAAVIPQNPNPNYTAEAQFALVTADFEGETFESRADAAVGLDDLSCDGLLGCSIALQQFSFDLREPGSIEGIEVLSAQIRLDAPSLPGFWYRDASPALFQFHPLTLGADLVWTQRRDGNLEQGSVRVRNLSFLTGTIDVESEPPTLEMSPVHFSTLDTDLEVNVFVSALTMTLVNQPPEARISLPSSISSVPDPAFGHLAPVQLDGFSSTDPDDDIESYIWEIDDAIVANGLDPIVHLGPGIHEVRLLVTDSHLARSSDRHTIAVDLLPDCNRNLVDDAVDILSGTSLDLDQDSTPDECQIERLYLRPQGVSAGGLLTVSFQPLFTAGGVLPGCDVAVQTAAGDPPRQVATQIAASVNSAACPPNLLASASVLGELLVLEAFRLGDRGVQIDSQSTGLEFTEELAPVVTIPTLSSLGMVALLVLLLGVATYRLRSRTELSVD